jgi:D-inositol-3-phosphate glycosyltransferase
MSSQKKIAIVVLDVAIVGGLTSVVKYLAEIIKLSGKYDLEIISLASSRKDAVSLRLLNPLTWFSFPKYKYIDYFGYKCTHVGAYFAELEPFRYKGRKILANILESSDLIQVVAGSPAVSLSVLNLGKPVLLQVATRSIVERESILRRRYSLPRKLMTFVVNRIDDYCIKNVNSIFVENQWMFDYCKNLRPHDSSGVYLAAPGINTQKYAPSTCNRVINNGYILSVGRFSDPRKNIIFLLECYVNIVDKISPPPRLVLAGSSAPNKNFWNLVERNNLINFVQFISNPSESELIDIYQGASCFALTSNEEGFGMVLIEAMACGIPVISTKCGGPEGIITDSFDGFLVDIGDHQKFSDHLLHLCLDIDSNILMGKHARSTSLKKYSLENTGKSFLAEYEKNLGF